MVGLLCHSVHESRNPFVDVTGECGCGYYPSMLAVIGTMYTCTHRGHIYHNLLRRYLPRYISCPEEPLFGKPASPRNVTVVGLSMSHLIAIALSGQLLGVVGVRGSWLSAGGSWFLHNMRPDSLPFPSHTTSHRIASHTILT